MNVFTWLDRHPLVLILVVIAAAALLASLILPLFIGWPNWPDLF
jgi:hypothetical protein